MKRLTEIMAEKLQSLARQQTAVEGEAVRQDFEFVEDFVTKMAFCKTSSATDVELSEKTQEFSIGTQEEATSSTTVSFDWPCHSTTQSMAINKDEIATAVDDAFFGGQKEICHDDQERPLGQLAYQTLLKLPPDIRSICMSRVTFCGQGDSIPGLRRRVLEEVMALMGRHGWNAVRGQNVKPTRKGLVEIAQGRASLADFKHNINLPPGKDFVDEKLFKQRAKEPQPGPQGSLQAVDTLGAWSGASLLTSLKIKGIVEVERERFLSYGLAGASKEQDVSAAPQRASTLGATKSSDRTSWTLAGWG